MYAGREYDASWREPYWARAYSELGGDGRAEDIVCAFKEFYTMFTDDLVLWYANLWDPYIGGYYCTTSGKENEGFLPDIESTYQALSFLESSGMISELGSFSDVISDEMKEKIAGFALRMQESSGYFYNLLKTETEIDEKIARRGRDLGWCTELLKVFGKTPKYDTPNGVKGTVSLDLGAKGDCKNENGGCKNEGERGASGSASGSASSSVSGSASKSYPDYLENKESFLKYLEGVDIVNKSYFFGNQLSATKAQIKARDEALRAEGADYSLCRILIDWLNERIDQSTGYWSPKPTFEGTNGYFKAIAVYNHFGVAYPEPTKATRSILDGILGDEPTENNICEVFNLWAALKATVSNAKKYNTPEAAEAVLAEIRCVLLERGAEAIRNTYKKQSAYQMPDGAFNHTVNKVEDRGRIRSHQGNIPVGLWLNEGDVDAIGKAAGGILNSMFDVFGISRVPIYHEREWKIYKEIIENAKPVFKPNTKVYR